MKYLAYFEAADSGIVVMCAFEGDSSISNQKSIRDLYLKLGFKNVSVYDETAFSEKDFTFHQSCTAWYKFGDVWFFSNPHHLNAHFVGFSQGTSRSFWLTENGKLMMSSSSSYFNYKVFFKP